MTLLKTLNTAYENRRNLGSELRKFLFTYRPTPHSSTGIAPFTLLFGREMSAKLPSVDVPADRPVSERARKMTV